MKYKKYIINPQNVDISILNEKMQQKKCKAIFSLNNKTIINTPVEISIHAKDYFIGVLHVTYNRSSKTGVYIHPIKIPISPIGYHHMKITNSPMTTFLIER